MKKTFLLAILATISIESLAQNYSLFNLINKDIGILDKKIKKLAFRKNCIKKSDSIEVFHIYYFDYDTCFVIKEFENETFLRRLKLSSNSLKWKKIRDLRIPKTESLICDKTGELIAISNGNYVLSLCDANYNFSKPNKNIADLYFNNRIDYCFYITTTVHGIYFCIKDNAISVVYYEKDKLETYPYLEYIKSDWNFFSNYHNEAYTHCKDD